MNNGLTNIRNTETFTFDTLEELRDFLNNFKNTELGVVYPRGSDYFTLSWHEIVLSDGSIVNDVTLTSN